MLVYVDSKVSFVKGKKVVVWGIVLALLGAIAVGEVSPVTVVSRADNAAAPAAPAGGGATAGAPVQDIAFQPETTIQTALSMLSQLYQKNIVPSTNVNGVLSFTRLYNVTFDEAMEAILGTNLKYEQVGQLVKVYTRDEYKKIKEDKDRMVHKVFTLYYVTAEEAVKLVKPVLSTGAVVQASTRAESSSGGGAGGGVSGGSAGLSTSGKGDDLAQNDTLVVYDFPENIEKAELVLKSLDRRPKQVLIEATILAARLTEGMELGVDLNFMAGTALDGTAATDTIVSEGTVSRGTTGTHPIADIGGMAGTPIESTGFAKVGGNGLRVGVSTGDFRMFITALESVTDTTILANPKILAVNKQEGSVLIGRNLGYRSSTSISAGGVATEGEVKFLQTGTQLVFRPYIGDDGYIRMDIYPKDSTAELNAQGVPDESTTQLRTNIVVKDGETIVLGGLFRDVVTTTRKQIPLLGDIPLIGTLFKGTTDSTAREEVIILLTPHIIEAAGQTEGDARVADIGRKRYGAREALQIINRSKIAEDHYIRGGKLYSEGNKVEALCEVDKALRLRPDYLEALRLKERITSEIAPDKVGQMERIMIGVIEKEDSKLWNRR